MAENLPANSNPNITPDAVTKIQEINQLEEAMYQVDTSHTLEEQLADMKRRGINPSQSYKNWDDDDDNWGNQDPNAIKKLKETDDVTPPPVV